MFDAGMLVKRSEPVMRLFQAILGRTSWQKVAGGVDKAIDEVLKVDASLRDLLPWLWTPRPKTIRSSVGDARKLESKPVVGWQCGDFIAAFERREANEQNADPIDLSEVVSDHGISWSRKGLANRIGPMATDKRHIGWMRTLLLSRKWRASLEVGCLGGASSVAFVDAVNERALMHAHFCDKRFTREFHQVAQKCWGAYTLHEEDSYECLSRFSKHELEFVYVDGDHSIETLQREYHQLARLKPAVVAAHDVVGDDGPGYLMVQLQRDGYFCLVDCKRRKGEGTHRGFLIACRDYDDYQLALEAYRRHIW
ncbi:class I SAM-dependent methyltransferase [Verrucomicrobium sp. BvORR034]|uniref:class I SAM-dependent methyltransferase n=1 Tax=Verrucomicrobium sp. BvORR034 TaxID=1396418 RepID=UPI0006784519|nr:class I SAM-dependent methyltransferase [Verrucomicrobium sp. BvORR034]